MRILKPKGAKRLWQGHSDAASPKLCVSPARVPLLWTPDWPLHLPRAPWGWLMLLQDPNVAPTTDVSPVTSFTNSHTHTAKNLRVLLDMPPAPHSVFSTPRVLYFYLYNFPEHEHFSPTWSTRGLLQWPPGLLPCFSLALTGHSQQPGISSEHKSDNIIFLA